MRLKNPRYALSSLTSKEQPQSDPITSGASLIDSYTFLASISEISSNVIGSLESPRTTLQKILEAGCKQLGFSTGMIGIATSPTFTVLEIFSDHGTIEFNAPIKLKDSFCHLVCKKGQTIYIKKSTPQPRSTKHPFFTQTKSQSYIGTPIYVQGKLFGTLNFSDTNPRDSDLSVDEKHFIEALSAIAAPIVEMCDKQTSSSPAHNRLANASHEIRTPLNGLLSMLDLLKHTELDSSQEKIVSTMQTSGDALLSLANNILDLSELEHEGLHLKTTEFSINQVIENACHIAQPIANKNKTSIELTFESPLPSSLIGDPLRIQQILLNLLNNSAKFTHNGKIELKVRAEQFGSHQFKLYFHVLDDGQGLPENEINQLFTPFFQSHSNKESKDKGSGLGLAIVKSIIDQMNGTIEARNRKNGGAEFIFSICLARN